MREYAIVPSKFWITPLAKALRGNPAAQVVALYLKTGPHANMIGLYHCPIAYIAQDTGIPIEGASKALASLSEAGYCTFDETADVVFVRDMAPEQIGAKLTPSDKRTKAVLREWSAVPSEGLRRAFHSLYAEAFHLPPMPEDGDPGGGALKPIASPIEGASKPLRSQEHEHEHEHEHEMEQDHAQANGTTKRKRQSQFPDDFKPNEAGEAAGAGLSMATELEAFKNHHTAKGSLMADWQAAWRTWCGNARKYAKPTAFALNTKPASKHAGFENLDYRKGINHDGSFT